jgi:hypothetical protein
MIIDFIIDDDYWDDGDKRRTRLDELRTSIAMKEWHLDTWRRVDNAPMGTWCRRPHDLVEVAEYYQLMYLEQSELAYKQNGVEENSDGRVDSKIISMLDELAEEKTIRDLINVLGWAKENNQKARTAVADTVHAGRLVSIVSGWAEMSENERQRITQTTILLGQMFTDEVKKRMSNDEL